MSLPFRFDASTTADQILHGQDLTDKVAVITGKLPSMGKLCTIACAKDSFINLDQDLIKVVKNFGQVESTVKVKITQKWI